MAGNVTLNLNNRATLKALKKLEYPIKYVNELRGQPLEAIQKTLRLIFTSNGIEFVDSRERLTNEREAGA